MRGFNIQGVNAATRAANPHIYGGENTERVGDAPDAVTEEDKLHDEIIKYCKDQCPPWVYFHGSMAHQTFRTKGEPDFEILASGGRVFLVECKSKTGKRSADQTAVAHWASRLGHKIHLITSMRQFRELVEPMQLVAGKSYEIRIGSSEYPEHFQAEYVGPSHPIGFHTLKAKGQTWHIHESNIDVRAREAAALAANEAGKP